MQRYWDFDESERASLTSEQVESLLNVELMEKGVLKPVPPTLESEQLPELPKRQYFEVFRQGRYSGKDSCGVVFDTIEQAQAFIALKPLKIDSDYQIGSDIYFVRPMLDLSIQPNDLPTEQDALARKPQLSRVTKAREENNKARDAHEKAMKECRAAGGDVWEDWYRCRKQQGECQRLLDVFEDYKRTAGDDATALRFLRKVYSDLEISKAHEWFGREVPPMDEPAPARAELVTASASDYTPF